MLDDGQGQAEDIDFLEAIGAHQVRGDLAGNADQWDRVHIGIGDAGDQVGGTGTGGGHTDSDLAGGARIGVCGKRRALLMAHKDMLQAGTGQGVIDGHDGAARITEHGLDPQRLQRGDDQLCACRLVAHRYKLKKSGEGCGGPA